MTTKKASTRIKKVSGTFTTEAFNKVLDQFHGRAVVVVLCMNVNCPQCVELMNLIAYLEKGNIRKLEKLVLVYGYCDLPMDDFEKNKAKIDTEIADMKSKSLTTKAGSTLKWEPIPEGHGYAIFANREEVSYYNGEFDHGEFKTNIMQAMRRFNSAIFTMADLGARKKFIENKRTGIIIETKSSTKQSIILSLEESVKSYSTKMKIPVYFLQGLKEEISLIKEGKTLQAHLGLDFSKFMKKAVKLLSSG